MMTTPNLLSETLHHAENQPWSYQFVSLLREIDAKSSHLPQIGTAVRVQQENVVLGQVPSLAFAPREIADIATGDDDKYHINLFSLGMLGPQGPLPLHFTEMIKDRMDNFHDKTLYHFLNLFHHRALALHYRAWAKTQATAGLDRAENEQFSQYIWALSGLEAQHTEHLPSHAYLGMASHFIQRQPDAHGLVKAITQYFNIPVQLHACQFHWLPLDQQDISRLGRPRSPTQLGVNAVMGSHIPDVQQRFCLEIGPLPLKDYMHFLPQSSHIQALIDLVNLFTGCDYQWDMALTIQTDSIPEACLGQQVRLGQTAWINTSSPTDNTITSGIRYAPLTNACHTGSLLS